MAAGGRALKESIPFDADHLDELMSMAGIDLLLATTKHNVQYLLGGYRFFFFAVMDAIGLSRYLPAVGYPRHRADDTFYIGNPMEVWQQKREPLWLSSIHNSARSSEETAEAAARLIMKLGLGAGTIGVEMPFLPADAYVRLQQLLPHARFLDVVVVLEELRAIKRPAELAIIKGASDSIVASMIATLDQARAGITTRELSEILRREETARGLVFDYCLAATAKSLDRAPAETRWNMGCTLSLDSGGTKVGYIGDIARMAVLGEPSAPMRELLSEVDAVQMAARGAVKPGNLGAAVYAAVRPVIMQSKHRNEIEFEAHGVGLVSHEVPHLADHASWPYAAAHQARPLAAGMVLSIETTLRNAEVGFVKLEDTVAVTDGGCEAYGDTARGWNVVRHG